MSFISNWKVNIKTHRDRLISLTQQGPLSNELLQILTYGNIYINKFQILPLFLFSLTRCPSDSSDTDALDTDTDTDTDVQNCPEEDVAGVLVTVVDDDGDPNPLVEVSWADTSSPPYDIQLCESLEEDLWGCALETSGEIRIWVDGDEGSTPVEEELVVSSDDCGPVTKNLNVVFPL